MKKDIISFKKIGEKDLLYIKELFNYYIIHSLNVFYTETLNDEEIREIIPLNHSLYSTYLIFNEEKPCGYCFFGQYKARQAYDRTSEVVLYLDEKYTGKGIGRNALEFLEQEALKKGIKNLLGVIAAPNVNSIKLFEKCGFCKCAHLRNVGEKNGNIMDVVIYQKEIYEEWTRFQLKK